MTLKKGFGVLEVDPNLCQKYNSPSLGALKVASINTNGAGGCVGVPEVIRHAVVGTPVGGFRSTASQLRRPTRKCDYDRSLAGIPVMWQNLDRLA